MTARIAENAWVDPRAEIDTDVEIGPFSVVGPHARIGRGTRLLNHVTVSGHVTIGRENVVYPNVVIGGEPQDISYAGSDTQVVIGDGNTIREGVTINRGSEKEDGITRIGNKNFLMACCHVAHDCKLGNHIIMANGALLGGHVHIDDYASLSGAVAVHHFTSIGSYSFIGAQLYFDRQLQLLGGPQPGVERRAAVLALRGRAGAAAMHQYRGAQATRLLDARNRLSGRGTPADLSRESRSRSGARDSPRQRTTCAASE
jgi:UDP-N-acetylglucosamine acyltransferase